MGLDIYFSKRKKELKEVAYFRKVNFLVKYVDEIKGEIDNCEDVILEKKDIEELVRRCDLVINSLKSSELKKIKYVSCIQYENGIEKDIYGEKDVFVNTKIAEELLPTTEGFFFGSASYDEYYLEDVKKVKSDMERILKEVDFETEEVVFYISY